MHTSVIVCCILGMFANADATRRAHECVSCVYEWSEKYSSDYHICRRWKRIKQLYEFCQGDLVKRYSENVTNRVVSQKCRVYCYVKEENGGPNSQQNVYKTDECERCLGIRYPMLRRAYERSSRVDPENKFIQYLIHKYFTVANDRVDVDSLRENSTRQLHDRNALVRIFDEIYRNKSICTICRDDYKELSEEEITSLSKPTNKHKQILHEANTCASCLRKEDLWIYVAFNYCRKFKTPSVIQQLCYASYANFFDFMELVNQKCRKQCTITMPDEDNNSVDIYVRRGIYKVTIHEDKKNGKRR